MSRDPDQEYFSDGIAEDIIAGLSRLRWFFVIARNSSFTYRGQAVDVRRVARELGVRYVLEGSVRKAGNRVRIAAQLIDGASGGHLWAERYDRDLTDVFTVQDEIVERVVASIEPQLLAAENVRAQRKAPANLDAWDYVMRALALLWRLSKADNIAAQELLGHAIRLDPNYAQAHSTLALSHVLYVNMAWGDPRTALPLAVELARTALSLDADDPFAHSAMAYGLTMARRPKEALAAARRALDLNPNFALGYLFLSLALSSNGKGDEAIRAAERAIRTSPRDPWMGAYSAAAGLGCFVAGRYAEAAEWADRAAGERPDFVIAHRLLATSAAQAGLLDEARAALAAARRLQPGISLALVEQGSPLADAADRARYIEGLRKAGLD